MRLNFLFCAALLLPNLLVAQATQVRITSLVLTKEKAGWRAAFPVGTAGKYSLSNGDLLTKLDDQDAASSGPLAVLAAFNEAFHRAVPVRIARGGQESSILLWRGDGVPPPLKSHDRNSAVASSMKVPDFSLKTLSGRPVALSAQKGRWVLVSFWATWCIPCQAEALVLSQLADEDRSRLQVIAVAVNDKPEKILAFVSCVHPSYTVVNGGSLQTNPALAYGVGWPDGSGYVPVNVLVRPDGTIAYVEGGFEAPSPLADDVNAFVMHSK